MFIYNSIRIYSTLVCCLFFIGLVNAQKLPSVKEESDSIKIQDTISGDSSKVAEQKQESLEDIVEYFSDKQSHDLKYRLTYLIGNAKVKYTKYLIESDYIEIDWNANTVYARGKQDSLGKNITPTFFKEDEKQYEYNSFKFNFKTKTGTAYNARLIENESLVLAKVANRKNDSISFLRNSIYTTDNYYLNKKDSIPDYHIAISKIKYINKKQIIAGPVQFYIEQVPTPLVLPFFTFPISDERKAGLILPTFGETEQTGFYLQGLGFYFPIKETADFKLTTDFYSRGSFGFHSDVNYKKRYGFSGTQRFDYENNVSGTKGLSDYNKNTLFRFNWSHTQDPKANPYLVFSSNVNISSTNYFSGTINNTNIVNQSIFTNTTSSSINLVKTFSDFPVNISLGLNHSQNNQTKDVNLTIPQLAVTLSRQYPFIKKGLPKKGLLQNIGIDYNLDTKNIADTKDSLLFKKEMFDKMQNGIKQNINLNTGTTVLRYFPLNFSLNYDETTYFERQIKSFNTTTNKVDETKEKGLSSFRTFTSGANISTTLYGMLKFKTGKISAIRHMIVPSVGFSYAPNYSDDFWGYYKKYIDNTGKEVSYSRYEGIYGSPNASESKSINFSFQNTLEMKVKAKADSLGSEYRKLKILERLSVSTSYNASVESFNWSNINFSGATNVFNEKLKLNFTGTINPYRYDEESKIFKDNFGSFKLTNYNLTASIDLNPELFETKEEKKLKPIYKKKGIVRYEKYQFDEDDYAQFPMKWNLNLGLNYDSQFNSNENSQTDSSSLQFSGQVSPSPYWDINFSSGYDLTTKQITFTSIGFKRDLRSFEIAFNWVPISTRTTWDFLINIKAPILKDTLKYNDRSFN